MNVTGDRIELTLEDYKQHKSFEKVEDCGHFWIVTMNSDITFDGKFKALDEGVVEYSRYQRVFFKNGIIKLTTVK